LILTFVLAAFAVVSAPANACSIPVFRYALEHWRPDPYVAFVFHRGELTPEQQKLIESMQPKAIDGLPAANLFAKTVDVDNDLEGDELLAKIWEENQTETLPHLVVHAPPKWGPPPTVFQGKFTAENVAAVMESPLRTTIKDRLLKGESVVWVYLECGRKEEDDAKFQLLQTELKRLQGVIELPAIDEADLKDLSVAPEQMKLKFSAVRLSRDDAREQFFRETLLYVEPDLKNEEYIDQPMAFPVFGRGRALYTLVGDGLAPDLIEEASRFLTGACQCTVKRENPGVDLLMHVDWDRFVEPTEAVGNSLPPLAGFSGFGKSTEGSAEEQLPAITEPDDDPQSTTEVPEEPTKTAGSEEDEDAVKAATAVKSSADESADARVSDSMALNVLIVLLLAGVVVIAATVLLKPKTSG
jgi:hypothetical protein